MHFGGGLPRLSVLAVQWRVFLLSPTSSNRGCCMSSRREANMHCVGIRTRTCVYKVHCPMCSCLSIRWWCHQRAKQPPRTSSSRGRQAGRHERQSYCHTVLCNTPESALFYCWRRVQLCGSRHKHGHRNCRQDYMGFLYFKMACLGFGEGGHSGA